jgi:hypothetical protein
LVILNGFSSFLLRLYAEETSAQAVRFFNFRNILSSLLPNTKARIAHTIKFKAGDVIVGIFLIDQVTILNS